MKKRFLGMVTAGILATVMLAGCGASASKVTAESLLQEEISRQLDNLMNQRENLLAVKGERKFISITEDGGENYTAQVIYPIIAEGDAIGTVILTTKDEKVRMGEMEMKLAASAASFLGRQLEQ